MSIESKIDVLAAAINRLADALTSKCSSSCHQTGAEVKPAAAPPTHLETVLAVTAADVTPWGANRIDIGVRRDHTCAALLERMHRGAQNHHARPGLRDQPAVDILVLDQVADWPWLDARATSEQMAGDVAHLVVAQGADCVAVTHVIEPGTTPCLGCHHNALADADGDWPRLCLQLAGRPAVDTADLGVVLVGAWRAAQTLPGWIRCGSCR